MSIFSNSCTAVPGGYGGPLGIERIFKDRLVDFSLPLCVITASCHLLTAAGAAGTVVARARPIGLRTVLNIHTELLGHGGHGDRGVKDVDIVVGQLARGNGGGERV